MIEPTGGFRYQPIKGAFEPWYCGIYATEDNHTLEAWYECPHCGQDFKTRAACEKHCKGVIGQFPATCHETKKGGKCYSGCPHA